MNEAWKSAMMGSASQWMSAMGVSREALQTPQAQAILYRAENPFVVGDSPAERASAISGGGSYHGFSGFFAAAGMARGVGAEARAAVTPRQGVYRFPDAKRPGKLYVGQSGNIPRRLRQWKSAKRYKPEAAGLETWEVRGGRLQREVEEQNRLDELGGLRGRRFSNERNPIGRDRIGEMGPDYRRP